MGAVNVEIAVSDPAAALSSFDVIRVRRSTTVDTGPYTEITAPTATAARIVGTTTGPFNVQGQSLELTRDNQPEIDVFFTGTNPLTATEVASQINVAAGVAIASVDTSQHLVLHSTLSGSASRLGIVGGSAVTTLGLVRGQEEVGLEAYVDLVEGQVLYIFADNDGPASGHAGYFYEAAFFNTTTLLQSAWSPPFQGGPGTQLGSDYLSIGTVDLVDAAGVATPFQRISFFSTHKPLQAGGFQVALNRAPVTVETDNAGHAEVALVRGLSVRVVFHGTPVIRDIVIPDAPTFDLLTLIEGAPDIFEVVTPNLPAAPRRTL